jgi:isopentenyl diphosphate isomerase/L-lactate dehydrogenase-like FMN-dependent dehydrogenase
MPRTMGSKRQVRRFALKSLFSALAVQFLVSVLINGFSALRIKTAQVKGVLDRNDRVMVKQTGWPNFSV